MIISFQNQAALGLQKGVCKEGTFCDLRLNFMACGGSGTCVPFGGWGAAEGKG